jgi:hypothetical protein
MSQQKEHDDRRNQQLPPPGDPVVVVRFVRTYSALVFTVFLVFILSGALIRWVTGSVWASNIGGLVAAINASGGCNRCAVSQCCPTAS